MVYLLLAGAINGVNRIFSLTTLDGQLAVPSSTYLEVWKNGSALIQGTDYALNSFVVTLVLAPQPAVGTNPTDWLLGVTDSATAYNPKAPSITPAATGPGTIITRAIDANGDPMRGHGLQNFAVDIYAVALILSARLQFLKGGWWLALSDGLPLFQQILGVPNTNQGVAAILRRQILTTTGVTGISSLTVAYSGASRAYTFQAVVQTVFGGIVIANQQQGALASIQWEIS